MAQVDTGLGWSANSEYLMSIAGSVCSIGGLVIAGDNRQPLPKNCISAADVVNAGFVVCTYQNNAIQYAACTDNTDVVVAALNDSVNPTFALICQTRYTRVLWVRTSPDGTVLSSFTLNLSSMYGSNYYGTTQYRDYFVSSISVPGPYANVYDMLATVSYNSTTFQKANDGYAVACVLMYNTINGILKTPVLISTDRECIEFSYTGTYSEQESSHLKDGRWFYMRIIRDASGTVTSELVPVVDLTTYPILNTDTVFKTICSSLFANVIVTVSPDPYEEEGGGSGEEGGEGEETEDDENGIEVNSDYPSAINTGFCRIYCPTSSQLQALSNYLWSNSYDLTQVKKLFSNPMDSVIGLSAVPIQLSGTSVNFTLGGVAVPDMTLPMVSQQRYTYYMGGITVKERWGSYLDYDPYTKFSIFLPFIGMRELSTDDIMGKQVMLYYDIDILSGICTARLQAGKHCLYEWGGSCALQLPINSRNWDSVFNTAVGAVSGIVSAVSGGAAPLVAGSVASAALQTVSMKPRVDKSGSVCGASGWLGQMTPYLIRTTPEAYVPSGQNAYIGYPSYMSVNIGSISGYNEIDSIHLENIPATGEELTELESILKGGAIF